MLCVMVFIMVVLGGVTRLTESGAAARCRFALNFSLLEDEWTGLSITEWKPIVGAIPPLDDAQWEVEFNKYKQSPEYIKCAGECMRCRPVNLTAVAVRRLHYNMNLEQFKFTYCPKCLRLRARLL